MRFAPTSLRLCAYHSGHHRATFDVRLGKCRSGTYRLVVAIDAGGKHSRLTRSIRLH